VTSFDLSVFEAPLTLPELRNGPVLLRGFAMSDLSLIRGAAADPYIPTMTSVPSPYSDDNGRAFIERQHRLALHGHGYPFVISESVVSGSGVSGSGDSSSSQDGVGALGMWLRDIENGRASIGYWLLPSARGKRLAGRALRAIVTYAFETLAIPRLQLFIEPWNVASQRTAEYAGFSREALLRGWERISGTQHDAYCYALLHQEWNGDGYLEGP
jgi:RimJ/RimL family protein N-acetyltransferase